LGSLSSIFTVYIPVSIPARLYNGNDRHDAEKVSRAQPTLQVTYVNGDWFMEFLKEKSLEIPPTNISVYWWLDNVFLLNRGLHIWRCVLFLSALLTFRGQDVLRGWVNTF
jgi:hypothetical protein